MRKKSGMELQKLHAKNTKRTDEVGRTQLADEMTPKKDMTHKCQQLIK